ncbi:MAG: ATP-binding protein [Actinomycetota bacterium]
MLEFLRSLFSGDPFMPHIHCFLENEGLTRLHVISDALIGLSYVAISATLAYLVYRARRDIPFHAMFLAFGAFIVACGMTHFMEIWTLWTPAYWLSGGVKAITAAASVITAIALPPLVPVAVKMVRDAGLSERRRLEVEAANAELNSVYEQLKELDMLKTQFFANVSHELRTPLTLITGPTERLLSDPGLRDDQRRSLDTIHRNAHSLLQHVNDLLDVARMDSGEATPHYHAVDLAGLVRGVAGNFETIARDRAIELRVNAPDRLAAELDPEKVRRILVNLLGNAFKFTPDGGVVAVELQVSAPLQGESQAHVEVRDSGPGIPVEHRDAVFERFRQLDGGADRRYAGTGLGLAIVQDFVKLHHGSVRVDEAPEGGARFIVALPLRAPEDCSVEQAQREQTISATPTTAPPARDQARAEAAQPNADLPTVLVVEDNPDLRGFIAETLEGALRVVTATDGEEGLERALAVRPDLIVTDVMMPRMTGEQLLGAVRKRPELEGVPVVVLTAKSDEQLRTRLLQEGAQDYVTKPFSANELRVRVHNLVSLKRGRDVLEAELSGAQESLESLARQVTARKRELETAFEAMRVARDQAEQAGQVKTNFLRLVSHELRTPLTAIMLQLQLLQRHRSGNLNTTERESLRKMTLAADRLEDLIASLLEHARIESGRLTVTHAPLDLAALVSSVVQELEPRAQLKHLELRCDAAPNLPPVASDSRLVRLVVSNLIDNAIKFTPSGNVLVAVRQEVGVHSVAVKDTGPGIAVRDRETIFLPFEQLEAVNHKHTPGVGLGLALVRQMVDAIGGRIELESEEGQGSTFTLYLPSVST